MSALVDARPCQTGPSGNQLRRMVPIVPVIPRRLEKKRADKHVGERSVGSASLESVMRLRRQPSSIGRDSSVVKDSSAKSENESAERKSSPAAEEDREFRMQKHASTPPPLSEYPTYNLVASPASQYDAPYLLQDPFTSSVQTVSTQSATFHSNPTPPIDSVLSPTDSSYQGYGHVPYKDFRLNPTPPRDTTPSPIEVSYPDYNHIPSSSFETQSVLPSDPPPPSAYSFYQGYSYGDIPPIFSPQAESTSCQRNSAQSEYGIDSPVGNESEVLPSFRCQMKNGLLSVPSSTSQEPLSSESKDTVTSAEILPLGLTEAGGFHREYSRCHGLGFHRRASSQSIEDSDDEQSLIEQAESGLANLSLERGVQYEVWRHEILASLDQAQQNASSSISPLIDYLAQEFNTTEHADCQLRIFHETRMCDIADFLLHSLLIDQSPLLRGLRKSTMAQENGITPLRIRTRNPFITPLAIETALQVCYGRSLVEYKGSSTEICSSKSSVEVSTTWMDNALALAASGYLFQLETVISRGLQIASSILNWENIEKALSFAMDGELGSEWDLDSSFRATTESLPFQISDDTITGVTPRSSEAVANRSNIQYDEQSSSPHHGGYSRGTNHLLLQCLNYILSNFPDSWELDILARPLADIDRLPMTAGGRSPLATSRLCQIQFGDHPSEQAKSYDVNIMLSSLLLSLPFSLFNYILDRLDETTRSRSINPIVDERERRRRQVVKCESISWSQRQEAADDWAQAGWEESVGLQNSRLCLQRKWVGFRAPFGSQI